MADHHDQPNVLEILALVGEFLRRTVAPALGGQLGFHALVAANLVGVVERDLELGTATRAAERDRLLVLLGGDGTLEELNGRLCRLIGEGAIAPEDTRLLAHLFATTIDRLAIDQPKYAAFIRERARLAERAP